MQDDDDMTPDLVMLPTWPVGYEPDSGTIRAICQILAMSMGAHEVHVSVNFGNAGVVNYSAPHPELVADDETPESDDATPSTDAPTSAGDGA